MSWGRRTCAILATVSIAASLAGCGKKEAKAKDTVVNAVHKTEQLARKFVYEDQTPTRKTSVVGLVEDSYRYQVRLSVNGVPIEEEATDDDGLAARSLAPDLLGALLTTAPANSGVAAAPASVPSGLSTDAQKSVTALQQGQWVKDPTGAPSLAVSPDDKRKQGDDPVFDALTALDYVERAVNASEAVTKFNPDSLEPTYKPSEDPFPKPKVGAKTQRWDLKQFSIPKPDSFSSTGAQIVPSVVNFRKMAIYIQDGVIVEVREVIDVQHRLPDLIRDYKIPSNTTAQQAVDALNRVRVGQGNDPLRLRSMVLDLRDVGRVNKVEMPTDAVTGSLSVLKYRGKTARVASTTGAPASGG